jgi:hypothetical protein
MKRPVPYLAAILCVLLPVVLVAVPSAGSGDSRNPELYRPGAEVLGQSRAYWASNFAKWEQEVPLPQNPLWNTRSKLNCVTDEAPLAYVGYPTSMTGRGPCAIPRGMPFSLAPFGWECSTAEGKAGLLGKFHGRTWKNLRRCATTMFARDFGPGEISLRLWVDGRPVRDVRQYVVTTQRRTAVLPERNVWEAFAGTEVPAGPTKTVSRLFSFIFKPLAPGMHRLRMYAEIPVLSKEPLRGTWRIRVTE